MIGIINRDILLDFFFTLLTSIHKLHCLENSLYFKKFQRLLHTMYIHDIINKCGNIHTMNDSIDVF